MKQGGQGKRKKAADFPFVNLTVFLTVWRKTPSVERNRRQEKTLWDAPGFKKPVMFGSSDIRNKLSAVLPGSALFPLCDLCSLHPLWWASFCCSTSHSTKSAEFVSLPTQSQTPASAPEKDRAMSTPQQDFQSINNLLSLELFRKDHFRSGNDLLPDENGLKINWSCILYT